MALMLPPALEAGLGLLGVPWPGQDEDGLRACATAYRACAKALTTDVIPLADAALHKIGAHDIGDHVETFRAFWAEYHKDGDDSSHLPNLATTLHAFADVHDVAADIVEALKVLLITCAAAALAWLVASAAFAGIGAVPARAAILTLRGGAQRSWAVFRHQLERFLGKGVAGAVRNRLRRLLGARRPLHDTPAAMTGGAAPGARRFTSDELRVLAETEARVQRRLVDRLGPFAPRIDFTSVAMDPRIAREFGDALDRLGERFPNVMAKLKEIGVSDPRSRFGSDGRGAYSVLAGDDRGIYFDPHQLTDHQVVASRYAANMNSGWLSQGWRSVQAIVHHEFGHHLLVNLPPSGERRLNQAIRDVLGRRVDVQGGMFHPATAARVREELGGYGATEPHEMIAEAFAEYMSSSSPRPLASAIGRELESIFN
ncbi:hypothetical protein [Sphaerisporangium fuscum]|uniref:hypothetical protein n=1 Tax=Sphaerisporangium fuscum TaxID=2835868 RepID=UPI001BDCCD76|nr:hypothetical protein [Sphaerisporangium fuscum]